MCAKGNVIGLSVLQCISSHYIGPLVAKFASGLRPGLARGNVRHVLVDQQMESSQPLGKWQNLKSNLPFRI